MGKLELNSEFRSYFYKSKYNLEMDTIYLNLNLS